MHICPIWPRWVNHNLEIDIKSGVNNLFHSWYQGYMSIMLFDNRYCKWPTVKVDSIWRHNLNQNWSGWCQLLAPYRFRGMISNANYFATPTKFSIMLKLASKKVKQYHESILRDILGLRTPPRGKPKSAYYGILRTFIWELGAHLLRRMGWNVSTEEIDLIYWYIRYGSAKTWSFF